jgi:hypothetical protein
MAIMPRHPLLLLINKVNLLTLIHKHNSDNLDNMDNSNRFSIDIQIISLNLIIGMINHSGDMPPLRACNNL